MNKRLQMLGKLKLPGFSDLLKIRESSLKKGFLFPLTKQFRATAIDTENSVDWSSVKEYADGRFLKNPAWMAFFKPYLAMKNTIVSFIRRQSILVPWYTPRTKVTITPLPNTQSTNSSVLNIIFVYPSTSKISVIIAENVV